MERFKAIDPRESSECKPPTLTTPLYLFRKSSKGSNSSMLSFERKVFLLEFHQVPTLSLEKKKSPDYVPEEILIFEIMSKRLTKELSRLPIN